MNEGRPQEAELALLRSLSIYPDFGATHACLMSIYHDQGKNDLAMQHARELKRLVPVDARPYFVLSEAARAVETRRVRARQAEEGLALDASYLPLHLAAGRGIRRAPSRRRGDRPVPSRDQRAAAADRRQTRAGLHPHPRCAVRCDRALP
ncbi:MAG: hypothetical protein U0527_12755 [Candidatus Eisenbacteria bacterium]